MIRSSVLRYGVRREEEIGARLSNETYMYSTELIDNPETDMSAMRFCGGLGKGQRKGPARGESGAQGGQVRNLSGGNAADAREGGETSAVMRRI